MGKVFDAGMLLGSSAKVFELDTQIYENCKGIEKSLEED